MLSLVLVCALRVRPAFKAVLVETVGVAAMWLRREVSGVSALGCIHHTARIVSLDDPVCTVVIFCCCRDAVFAAPEKNSLKCFVEILLLFSNS